MVRAGAAPVTDRADPVVDAAPVPGRAESRAGAALVALTVAGALAVLWVPHWIAAQDLPAQMVGQNVVLHPDLYPWHAPNRPLTQWAFNGLVLVLGSALPLLVATRLALSIGLIAWVAVWGDLARRWQSPPAAVAALAAAQWVGWLHVMGFYNYAFGLLLGAVGLWLVARPDRPTPARIVGAAVAFVAAVFGHVIGAGHALVFVGVWALALGLGATWRAVLGASSVAAVLGLWVTNEARRGEGVAGLDSLAGGWLYGAPADRVRDLFGTTWVGYGDAAWLVGVAALVFAIGIVLAPHANPVRRRFAALALGVGLVVHLLAPTTGLGWAFAAQRLLVVPLLLVAALAPPAVAWRRAGLAIAGLSAVATWTAVGPAARVGGHTAEAVAAFGEAPVGRAYPVLFDADRAVAAPHADVDVGVANYALLNGGMAAGMFSTAAAMHWSLFVEPIRDIVPGARSWYRVVPRCAEADCGPRDFAAGDEVAVHAVPFDAVVVVDGTEAFTTALAGRGYAATAPGVWRLDAASLVVQVPPGLGTGLVAQVSTPGGLVVAEQAFAGDDAGATAAIDRTVAGPVVLRVGRDGALLLEAPLTLVAGETETLRLGDAPPE